MPTAKLCCAMVTVICILRTAPAWAEHDGKVQIVLLGDSTTEGSVPRRHVPKGPHLEDVIRGLLEEERDLPPTNVINLGLRGDETAKYLAPLMRERFGKR